MSEEKRLRPGRKLDALVAEKVMGWKLVSDSDHWAIGWNGSSIKDASDDYPVRSFDEFRPSSDMASALEVLEHLLASEKASLKIGPCRPCNVHGQLEWLCEAFTADGRETLAQERAETAPIAICLAALKAVGAI